MRTIVAVVLLVLGGVVSSTDGLEYPEVRLTNRTSYFVHLGEVQADTLATVGWRRLSVAQGVGIGLVGYARYDSTNVSNVSWDEFVRRDRAPALGIEELSVGLNLAKLWPASENFFGGSMTFKLGKFLFPMFGVGDVVRLNDVLVPHNFSHNPVVRDPTDPTADERFTQYGVLATWQRKLLADRYRLRCEGAYQPVFVPNRHAVFGPWRIAPTGVTVEQTLPSLGHISSGQQFALRSCLTSNESGGEFCGMVYEGRDQTPWMVSSAPTAIRLVYPRLRMVGASFVHPVPFTESVLFRGEFSYADYDGLVGRDYVAALATFESVQTVRGRGLFLLAQGMWRSVSDSTQPLQEILRQGALVRIRYGALFGENGWALQFEGGVNADPLGYVIEPAVFLPMPSFLDGVWESLGVEHPQLGFRYVVFGGDRRHAFGGLYRNNDFVAVELAFTRH